MGRFASQGETERAIAEAIDMAAAEERYNEMRQHQ